MKWREWSKHSISELDSRAYASTFFLNSTRSEWCSKACGVMFNTSICSPIHVEYIRFAFVLPKAIHSQRPQAYSVDQRVLNTLLNIR